MTQYVDSTATGGSNNGTNWANAWLASQSALTNAAAGEEVWVSVNHAEVLSAGNQTLTCSNGTDAAPVVVLSMTPVGAAGGTYTAGSSTQIRTNTVASDDLSLTGSMYWVGIMFSADLINPSVGNNSYRRFVDCHITSDFQLNCTSSSVEVNFFGCTLVNTNSAITGTGAFTGARGTRYVFDNCVFSALTDADPVNFFYDAGNEISIFVKDCDLSALSGFSGSIFAITGSSRAITVNSKFPAETIAGTLIPGAYISMFNSGAGNTNVDRYVKDYFGEVSDSTSIYLAGSDGTTSYSFLMDPSGNGAKEQVQSLRYLLGAISIDASAGVTIKVNITYDSATPLQDDEFWIEVEYADDTTNLGLIATTAPGLATTPSNLTTNSESWTGTGGFSNPVTAHCITSAISDGKACMALVYACLVKDQVVYVCPEIVVG